MQTGRFVSLSILQLFPVRYWIQKIFCIKNKFPFLKNKIPQKHIREYNSV